MEQLSRLWEYQELDDVLDQYLQEKRSLASRQRLLKLRNYLIEQDKYLVSLDDDVKKKNKAFHEFENECENIKEILDIKRSKLESEDIGSIEEIEEMAKEGIQLKDKVLKKEEELEQLIKDLEEFQGNLDDIRTKVSKAKREYSKIKKEYDSEVASIKKKEIEVKKEQKEIAKDIDGSLVKRYENIKTSRTPVIAKLINGNQCSGCYMSLASLVVQKVKEKDKIIQCENCGRILYYVEE